MSTGQRERLVIETLKAESERPCWRDTVLVKRESLSTKTLEQTKARKKCHQRKLLATETLEKRESLECDLECDRQMYRKQHTQLLLFDWPSVQSTMLNFHGYFSALEVPTYST